MAYDKLKSIYKAECTYRLRNSFFAEIGYKRVARRPVQEVVNAIFYVLRGGISWRTLSPRIPPWRTVYAWFAAWREPDVRQTINHDLVMLNRERSGHEASTSER
ncbi:MAG: transposase [Janthinobacterium lividum]